MLKPCWSTGSVVGEEDEVPELREGRFAQRMKKGKMWTSEDSYENDREVMSESRSPERFESAYQ